MLAPCEGGRLTVMWAAEALVPSESWLRHSESLKRLGSCLMEPKGLKPRQR